MDPCKCVPQSVWTYSCAIVERYVVLAKITTINHHHPVDQAICRYTHPNLDTVIFLQCGHR